MVNSCCLPNCRSGSLGGDGTTSLFRSPKDPSVFEKWASAVKIFHIDLKPKNFICEKHFLDEDILREKVLRDLDGKIIFQRKYDKIRLRRGAVPFASAPGLVVKTENSDIPVPLNVADDEGALANNATIVTDLTPTDTVKKYETDEESVDIGGGELSNELTSFDDIYDGIIKLKLPDSSWGIHMRDEPVKCITISQVEKCRDTDKVPSYIKQITLNEQLHLKLFVLHSKVVERAATTIQEVQSALEEMYNLQVCLGGPVLGTFKNVYPRCAYRDVIADRWRHNLCSLVTERWIVCSKCRSLDNILRAHLDRRYKSKKLDIVVSPTYKKKIEIKRKAHCDQMQASKRDKLKMKAIKLEVEES